jgi:hypothetical protein
MGILPWKQENTYFSKIGLNRDIMAAFRRHGKNKRLNAVYDDGKNHKQDTLCDRHNYACVLK